MDQLYHCYVTKRRLESKANGQSALLCCRLPVSRHVSCSVRSVPELLSILYFLFNRFQIIHQQLRIGNKAYSEDVFIYDQAVVQNRDCQLVKCLLSVKLQLTCLSSALLRLHGSLRSSTGYLRDARNEM